MLATRRSLLRGFLALPVAARLAPAVAPVDAYWQAVDSAVEKAALTSELPWFTSMSDPPVMVSFAGETGHHWFPTIAGALAAIEGRIVTGWCVQVPHA